MIWGTVQRIPIQPQYYPWYPIAAVSISLTGSGGGGGISPPHTKVEENGRVSGALFCFFGLVCPFEIGPLCRICFVDQAGPYSPPASQVLGLKTRATPL